MSGRAERNRVFEKRFPQLVSRLFGSESSNSKAEAARALAKHSIDWRALLERWLDSVELTPNTVFALTGFGDGSHVATLLDRLPGGSYVFCAEKNLDCFHAISAGEEQVALLEDPRLLIGIGSLDAAFFGSLSSLPVMELTDAKPLVFAPLYNQESEYYASFLSEFTRAYEYWRKLHGTNVIESRRWQNNTFENSGHLTAAPDIKELEGAFAQVPVILVSAGPSLDVSLDFVKANEKRCVVVAVNSSYRALRNYGIVPHFVIAADPYEYTDRGFEGLPCDQTALICPFIVYPKVVERFQGRIFTWSQNNLLASYLRLVTRKGMGSEIQEIGTVSACIFDIARIWGSSKIVFVGQDLAAKADGQLHNSDSFYADLGANHLNNENCRILPGNVEEGVKVESKLYIYLKAFESLAQKHGKVIELYNTSVFGARIEGIPYAPLAEMAAQLERSETGDLSLGLRTVEQVLGVSGCVRNELATALASLSQYGRLICQTAVESALALEKAVKQGSSEVHSAVEEAERLKKKLETQLAEDSDRHQIMSDGALKYERMLYRRAIQSDSLGEDELMQRGHALREYFWAVAEGSFAFYGGAENGRLSVTG